LQEDLSLVNLDKLESVLQVLSITMVFLLSLANNMQLLSIDLVNS